MPRIVVFVVLAIGLVRTGSAVACSCELHTGPIENQVTSALRESAAVFLAEVVQVEDFMAGLEAYQATKLKVLKSWKGPHTVDAAVRTATHSTCCLCGIAVKEKQVLLVYVTGKQPYKLSDCSRTDLVSRAAADIEILNRLSPGASPVNRKTPNKALQRTLEDSRR
jgi:hypothetical protein